jgi:YD repeat-containing protein
MSQGPGWLSAPLPGPSFALEAYDSLNRRIRTTDVLGHTTQYEYNGVGTLVRSIDTNDHRTAYEYDAVNRLVKRPMPTAAIGPSPATVSATFLPAPTRRGGLPPIFTTRGSPREEFFYFLGEAGISSLWQKPRGEGM